MGGPACAAVPQSLPVGCHFRGCKAPLSWIVSGAISSELPLALPLPLVIWERLVRATEMGQDGSYSLLSGHAIISQPPLLLLLLLLLLDVEVLCGCKADDDRSAGRQYIKTLSIRRVQRSLLRSLRLQVCFACVRPRGLNNHRNAAVTAHSGPLGISAGSVLYVQEFVAPPISPPSPPHFPTSLPSSFVGSKYSTGRT